MRRLAAILATLTTLTAVTLTGCSLPDVPTGTTSGGPAAPAEKANDGKADVTVKSCKADQFGLITAKLSIKNSGKEARSYLVTVSANDDKGNRVAELNGAANKVAAGQTAAADAIGSVGDSKAKVAKCVVADVTVTEF